MLKFNRVKKLLAGILAVATLLITATTAFAANITVNGYQTFSVNDGTKCAAIKDDNSLWTWDSSIKPIKIMENAVSVYSLRGFTGGDYYAAIKTDGSLWMWGDNRGGAFGNGTTIDSASPVKVMSDVVGFYYSHRSYTNAVIKTDGSLWMWGDNRSGQLGNGTTTNSLTPVKVMENVAAVSLGGECSAAIQKNGALYMWGYYADFGYQALLPENVMDNVTSVVVRTVTASGMRGGCALVVTESGECYAKGGYGVFNELLKVRYHNAWEKIMDGVAYLNEFSSSEAPLIQTQNGETFHHYWSEDSNGNFLFPKKLGDNVKYYKAYENSDGKLIIVSLRGNMLYIDSDGSAEKVMDRVSLVSYKGHNFILKEDGSVWGYLTGIAPGTTERDPFKQLKAMKQHISGIKLPNGNELIGIVSDKPSAWAEQTVKDAIAAGLVPENLQKNYTRSITRADTVQLFINLIEKVSEQSIDFFAYSEDRRSADGSFHFAHGEFDQNPFSDTNDSAVCWGYNLGIINGVGGGRFDPNGVFTRAQAAAIINRIGGLFDVKTSGYTHDFTDLRGHWADGELGWPVHAGIVSGIGGGKFDPDGKLTTEQAIAIAYRALQSLKS